MATKEIIPTSDFAKISSLLMVLKNEELKTKIKNVIIEALNQNQQRIVVRAIEDGYATVKEINEIKTKYQCDDSVIAELFKHKYDEGFVLDDEKEENSIMLITVKGSKVYQMKDFIKEKYDINVILVDEAIKKVNNYDKSKKSERPDYVG